MKAGRSDRTPLRIPLPQMADSENLPRGHGFPVRAPAPTPDLAIILSPSLLRMIDGRGRAGGASQSMDVFMQVCNQRVYFLQNEKKFLRQCNSLAPSALPELSSIS